MAIINYIEKHLKTFNVRLHKHDYWEIIYTTEGVGSIKALNRVIEYKKDELILIPPNVWHTNNSSVGFKNIHFTIEDWYPSINEPTLIPLSDSSKDFYTIIKLAYHYFHEYPANHPININLTNLVESFLNTLISQSDTYNITEIIVHEIVNHYTNPSFDLEEAYALVPLSKEYLRKIFIKEHGISPLKFLQQKRITLAKQLLSKKDDNLRINEISEICGFNDLAYFSRIFKKETGFSPKEFQLKLLEDNKIYS